MDIIFIDELRLQTRIGVYAWERHVDQTLVLDLQIGLPSSTACVSDQLSDALDYSAVVARLRALAANHPYRLLERFAEGVAEVVVGEFGAPWVRVQVAKLAPLAGVRRLGVAIERRG